MSRPRLKCPEIDDALLVEMAKDYLSRTDLSVATQAGFAAQLGMPGTTLSYRLLSACWGWGHLKRLEKIRRLEALMESPGKLHLGNAATECGFTSTAGFLIFFQQVRGENFTQWRMTRQVE
jgi:AraC-like DNA-binding protein